MAELGVLIPILGILTGMLAIWTRHQRSIAQIQSTRGNELGIQQADRIEELEDRLRVLERIVTDKGYDVATQIEALRDQRSVDAQLAELEDRSRG